MDPRNFRSFFSLRPILLYFPFHIRIRSALLFPRSCYTIGIRKDERLMTTQQIRFFLETARCLSFTEAARNLFVTQPTLSKQIALMESELGIKLFYRRGRTVTLTPSGLILRTELGKLEASLSVAIDHAQRVEKGADGHLSCCLLDVIDPNRFAFPAIRRFQAQYPNVELELIVCGFREIRERLTEERVDVAFSKQFELRSIAGLEYLPVYSVTPSVLISNRHPLAQEPFLTMSQLKDESFIILELGECPFHVQSLIDLCAREGFYPKISKYANSNMTRIYYVNEGYGVSLMDGELTLPTWAEVTVIPTRSPLKNLYFDTDVELAWRRNCSNPTVQLFRETVSGLLQETGYPHRGPEPAEREPVPEPPGAPAPAL